MLGTLYIAGFAGTLMLAAWLHVKFWPVGGMWHPKATPWLLLLAVLWPCGAAFVVMILGLGPIIHAMDQYLDKYWAKKDASKQEQVRQWAVHAGLGKLPIHPPYDGSQRRKRYWKKVKEVDGAVSLKRKSRGPRSRT